MSDIPVTQLVFGQRRTIAMMLGSVGTGTFVSGVGSLIVIYARDFGMDKAAFAPIASAFGAMMLVAGAVGKQMIDRFSISALHMMMAAMAMVGYTGIIIAPGYWVTIAAVLLTAFASAMAVLLAPVVFEGPDMARAIGLTSGLSSVAAVASPLFYGLFDKIPGVSGRVGIAVGFLTMIPMFVISWRDWHERRAAGTLFERGMTINESDARPEAPETEDDADDTQHDEDDAVAQIITRHDSYIPFSRQPLRVKAFFGSALVRQIISMFAEYVVYAWAATRLMQQAMDEGNASIAAALFPLGMMVGRLGLASQANRRGMMQILSVFIAVGMAGIVLSDSAISVSISLFVAGIGVSLTYPIAIATVTSIPRMNPAVATSIAAVTGGLSAIIGPQIAAAVGHAWGMNWAFALIGCAAIVLFFLPGRLTRHTGRQ